jgi:rfaE bifunctional protein kinase chain/domain
MKTTMQSSVAQISAVNAIRTRAGPDKRIAFVSGNFNVVHPGHLRLLKFAAESADYLVVGVNPDGTPGVTVPADMRLDGLSSISLVDDVVMLEEEPEQFIASLRPDVVVKGREYAARQNAEQTIVDEYGGKLLFSSGEVRFSSINLLQREYFETNFSTVRKPKDFPLRHGFAIDELKSILPNFAGVRVLVIGDLIVDTYINCDPIGMSQEDPTIVVTPIESKTFVGGAGIVAAHARGVGADVRFLTMTGDDKAARFAVDQLRSYNVDVETFIDQDRPTTHKERYRALGKTLLRVNHLRQHPANTEIMEGMLAKLDELLPTTDLILFSDFNYGCLPQQLVDRIVERASARNIMMAADSQASSQLSDISRFRGMALITPTEREARLALQDFESGLVIIAERLKAKARARNVIVTLGSEGLLVHAPSGSIDITDKLPAFNTAPKDVAGAGDSFFACASLALCCGIDVWRSTYLGALAAACQVSRVGNLPLNLNDLITEIDDPNF